MHKLNISKCMGVFLFIGLCAFDGSAKAETGVGVPFVHAASACLIDVNSGRILYEKNGQQPMRIASLTKVVTGWIAIKSGKLDRLVTVSNLAARQEGSSVYLKAGERVKLRDLLYAMMLRSGNDAAMAIAEAVAGSNDRFASLMNAEVKKLGLSHTHFANPHGLDNQAHYASADDFATLTAAALKTPLFRQIVATRYYRMERHSVVGSTNLKNKNRLLWMMQGADGVKTGFTRAAGRCLAASASLAGRQVAVVLLDDPADWVDAKRLLVYGLHAYTPVDVAKIQPDALRLALRDGVQERVVTRAQHRIVYPLCAGEAQAVTYRIVQKRQRAPVHVGDPLGVLYVSLHGKPLGETQLLAAQDVPAKSLWGKLRGLFS